MGRAANISRNARDTMQRLMGNAPRDRFGMPLMEGGRFTHSTFLPPVYKIERIEVVVDPRLLQQVPPGVQLLRVEASARWSMMIPAGQMIEQLQMIDYPDPPAADNGNGGDALHLDESDQPQQQSGDTANGQNADDTQAGSRSVEGGASQLPPGPRRIITTD